MNEERMVGNALSFLAARMRDDLGSLMLSNKKMTSPKARKASPEKDRLSAYAERSRIRLLRLARNMETCGALLCSPEFEREPCDVVELMSELCEGAADLAKMANIRLTFSCAESGHICAVHPEYLRMCLENLLSNAFKSAPGGGRVRMIFRKPRTERSLILSVEDDGSGIEPERLPTLFEGFWEKPVTAGSFRATGLGLPLCGRVAEGHGGQLTAESVPGKGSVFTLRIPDAPAIMGPDLRQDGFFVADGGLNPILVMLSDALPWEAFTINQML